MKQKTTARVGKQYLSPIARDIYISTIQFSSQDIDSWRIAIDEARNQIHPKRRKLIELYENIVLDAHLYSVMQKRITALSNKKILFSLKGKDGEFDDTIQDNIIQTPWFYQMTKFKAEAKAYGFSLVELIPKGGIIESVELIPRKVVRPQDHFMQWSEMDYSNGVDFEKDKKYSKYMIGFGDKHDFGLLSSAAQYVIYKRGGFGDWAQYSELFGMPFRVGKYNQYDEVSKTKLHTALQEMGGAAHAVIPQGTDLEFHDSNGTGKSEVYQFLIEACNAELSKLFLGQTMTTEDGSSKSQSQIHKEVEDELMLADMIEYEYDLNFRMINKLNRLGYNLPEGHFQFDQTKKLPKDKLIDIAVKVAQNVPIADDYWYKTFEIEKPDAAELKRKEEDASKILEKQLELQETSIKDKEKKEPPKK